MKPSFSKILILIFFLIDFQSWAGTYCDFILTGPPNPDLEKIEPVFAHSKIAKVIPWKADQSLAQGGEFVSEAILAPIRPGVKSWSVAIDRDGLMRLTVLLDPKHPKVLDEVSDAIFKWAEGTIQAEKFNSDSEKVEISGIFDVDVKKKQKEPGNGSSKGGRAEFFKRADRYFTGMKFEREISTPGRIDTQFLSKKVKLHGTLTVPSANYEGPVVVFTHGSGAVDRDGAKKGDPNSPKLFLQISNTLVSKGLATFRFDKRLFTYGKDSRPWKAESFSPNDLVEDIRNAMNHSEKLLGRGKRQFILISHSESGNFIDKIAVKDSRVIRLILLSAPFDTLDRALYKQFYPQLEEVRLKLSSTEDPKEREALTRSLQILEERLVRDGTKMMSAVRQGKEPSVSSYLGFSKRYISDWMRIMDRSIYDLCSVNQPTLVIGGEQDNQSPIRDWAVARAACDGKPHITFETISGIGHMLTDTKGVVASAVQEKISAFVLGALGAH